MTRTRRALAVLFATAAATVATAVPAHADTGATTACATGYLCLNPSNGPQILVLEGKSQEFPGGIKATIANRTTLRYCVSGGFNFSVPAGGTVTDFREISAVGPMPTGGACLH